jgi:hypothetical protein
VKLAAPGLLRTFYLALGFDPSPLDPMTLMETLADLRAAR